MEWSTSVAAYIPDVSTGGTKRMFWGKKTSWGVLRAVCCLLCADKRERGEQAGRKM